MNESKFNLWRACFAFTHIDKKVTAEERRWMDEKMTYLNFTPDQRKVFENDFNSPPLINEILPLITRPADRAFLVDQIRILSKLDGNLSPEEKNKIEEIKNIVLQNVNFEALEAEISGDELTSFHELLNYGNNKFPER